MTAVLVWAEVLWALSVWWRCQAEVFTAWTAQSVCLGQRLGHPNGAVRKSIGNTLVVCMSGSELVFWMLRVQKTLCSFLHGPHIMYSLSGLYYSII